MHPEEFSNFPASKNVYTPDIKLASVLHNLSQLSHFLSFFSPHEGLQY